MSKSPSFKPEVTIKRPVVMAKIFNQTQPVFKNLDIELAKKAKREQKLRELRNKHALKKIEKF
jgi:hypothetical protein